MLRSKTIGFCRLCEAECYIYTDGGDYESEKAKWRDGEWDCLHEMDGFDEPKIAEPIRQVIDDFQKQMREFTWPEIGDPRPKPKFRRGI